MARRDASPGRTRKSSRGGREGVAALPGSIADVTIALRRKRSHRRRRLGLRLLVGALILGLLGGLVWLAGFSQVLAADHVEVRGTRLLTVVAVTDRAAVPLGTPLARLDTEAIAERVATLPAVAEVQVSRRWPKGVRVTVVEREPMLQRRDASGFTWVDAQGVAFHRTPSRTAQLIEVRAPDEARLTSDLVAVATSLTPALRLELEHIAATSPDTITLHLSRGRRIIWGSASESSTKASVATALLKVKASVYDVSSPANPTSR